MNQKEAFSILNISGNVTPEDIKTAYRKACSKYHPDRNPAGLEMMKLVNVAYEEIKDFAGDAEKEDDTRDLGEELNNALNAIIGFDLSIEVCGMWIWVTGDTKTHKDKLKEAGYMWAPKKQAWYFRTSKYKSFNRSTWSIDRIRENYGSYAVKGHRNRQLDN